MGDKKAFEFKIEAGKIVVALDTDKDGEASVKLEIDINEVISEAIAKIAS